MWILPFKKLTLKNILITDISTFIISISSFTFLINKSSEGKIETEDLSFKNEEIEVLMSQGSFFYKRFLLFFF